MCPRNKVFHKTLKSQNYYSNIAVLRFPVPWRFALWLYNTAWLDQNLSKRFLKQLTVSAQTTWSERLFRMGITRLEKLNSTLDVTASPTAKPATGKSQSCQQPVGRRRRYLRVVLALTMMTMLSCVYVTQTSMAAVSAVSAASGVPGDCRGRGSVCLTAVPTTSCVTAAGC